LRVRHKENLLHLLSKKNFPNKKNPLQSSKGFLKLEMLT